MRSVAMLLCGGCDRVLLAPECRAGAVRPRRFAADPVKVDMPEDRQLDDHLPLPLRPAQAPALPLRWPCR